MNTTRSVRPNFSLPFLWRVDGSVRLVQHVAEVKRGTYLHLASWNQKRVYLYIEKARCGVRYTVPLRISCRLYKSAKRVNAFGLLCYECPMSSVEDNDAWAKESDQFRSETNRNPVKNRCSSKTISGETGTGRKMASRRPHEEREHRSATA